MAEDGADLFDELMRFKPEGLSANAWAVQAGVGRTIWADLRRHGNPSRRTLSKLLEAAGSSLAEFEALRLKPAKPDAEVATTLAEPRPGWGHPPAEPLPLLGTRAAGAWGEGERGIDVFLVDHEKIIDRLVRPAILVGDRQAYAVTTPDNSMWPRFRPGRRLAVSPAAAITAGDDVLLILAKARGALIGELQSRSSTEFTLRQFNPPRQFEINAAEVESLHKVIGELI